MKIGIIGMGFVGGTTAQVLSKAHEILPYDRYKNPYTTQQHIEELVKNAEVVFICVPTPMKPSGEIDYSPMHHSLRLLKEVADKVKRNPADLLITIRSTAVSGTTDSFAKEYPFKFAFNPEFLREKHALGDMLKTDEVVLGVEDKESEEKLLSVYKPIFPDAKYTIVKRKEAEMIKYARNVLLTLQIAGANEIYNICEALGINYDIIKNAALSDKRIGRNLDVPGPDGQKGFGGKCFPKDLNALIYLARKHGYRPHFLEEAWSLNERVRTKKDWLDIPGAVSSNTDFKKE
ncbi:MAG: hypothetical protein Q7S74_04990 [Nanoarchaeota archaeon]|nr:hypothetical protein [Nanoarchaeota archaeon]